MLETKKATVAAVSVLGLVGGREPAGAQSLRAHESTGVERTIETLASSESPWEGLVVPPQRQVLRPHSAEQDSGGNRRPLIEEAFTSRLGHVSARHTVGLSLLEGAHVPPLPKHLHSLLGAACKIMAEKLSEETKESRNPYARMPGIVGESSLNGFELVGTAAQRKVNYLTLGGISSPWSIPISSLPASLSVKLLGDGRSGERENDYGVGVTLELPFGKHGP